MPKPKDSLGPKFRPEPTPLPPARVGRRPRPSVYRDQITECLATGGVRSTLVPDAAEARRVIKRLRHAGDALDARVSVRQEPAGDQIKIRFSASRKGP